MSKPRRGGKNADNDKHGERQLAKRKEESEQLKNEGDNAKRHSKKRAEKMTDTKAEGPENDGRM